MLLRRLSQARMTAVCLLTVFPLIQCLFNPPVIHPLCAFKEQKSGRVSIINWSNTPLLPLTFSSLHSPLIENSFRSVSLWNALTQHHNRCAPVCVCVFVCLCTPSPANELYQSVCTSSLWIICGGSGCQWEECVCRRCLQGAKKTKWGCHYERHAGGLSGRRGSFKCK